MADGCVPVVLSPEPFARTTTYVEAPAGCTVRTMLTSAVARGHLKLDDLGRTNIYVDGVRLDRDDALTMVLREGQVINVVVEPLGGGGGGKKDVGQILLTIAVIAVSMWVGGPAGPLNAWPMLARQVAAAAVLTAGQMAIAAIFKPETNVAKANDRYALSSASNQYRQWGSMPLALGEVVVAPDLAVKTFTQAHGEDQWIYGILGLHYGPCTAEDLKIGDTLVSSMGAGDVRVAYHLTPGPRTFSIVANDTDQLDLQEELPGPQDGSTPVVRAASAEGEQFEFDFFMPQGLYFAKDDGRKLAASMTVSIRYRPIDQNGVPTGAGAWANGLTIPLTSSSSDPWRFTRSISLPLGRYEFEVRRSPSEDPNPKRRCDIGWTAIRAIAFRKPVMDETLSLIEFAVRASALNQGNLAPFTCRITPICETWTGSAWGPPAPTSNPAAVTRWLMTGPAPALPLSSIQADVGLRTWAALCDQYNWKAHIYLTEDRKQDAVLQLLGMNGRASLFWDGTQLVASTWTEKPAPRQLFAGSNLKDHRWEIVFPDPVHALRVEFQNIDQGGEADEVYVYADGYGETADPKKDIEAATLVEALRLEGQQTIERAYRDGRWNLAARLHQRRVDSWSTDIEHIVCRYGDRVRLAWDRVGTANATVRNRIWSGGLVSGLRLSQPVRMEPGRSYALDLRLPDQVLTGVPVVNPATTEPVVTRTVSFASETAAGQQASAASQDRQAAQTARGEAQGFRDQSSAAASTASGAAATTTEQAGLAATARGEAQGFAGAALDYRNQASGFVTAAEAAAAASSASSVTATASKDAAKNYAINQGSITPSALLWTNNPNGVPETATDATYPVVTVGGKPSMILGDNQHVFWKRAVPFVAGHVYEIQVEVEPSTASAAEISLIIWQLDGSYANLPAQNYQLTSKSIPVRGLYTQRFTPNAATVWLRPAVKGEMGSKNPRIFSLNIIDVTAQAAAEASATAASTSVSSAAASETAAGQSASAANTAKVAAETARGQAEGFKNQAVQAYQDAQGQASIATTQAGLASGSATLAGDKAKAASDSASLARTKADEAGASAAASRADQISASAARDQALAALMAQGRQNLVARQNVPTAQVVTFGAGSLSGWGFSMVGTGTGSQERSITVGPLKRNTAYSVSILARRVAGSGSAPINCDFFPDTLPERTFDVQANAWTRFTWENITSASADMELSTVRLRFFRPNMAAGLNVEITDIKLEEGSTATAWTPSAKDAPYSASAAATSAASAAASDTAAGQKAAAAEGSATTAATRAGEALTYRNQASSAASDAAGYAATASLASGTSVSARDQSVAAKDQAVGAKDEAQAAAATAIQQKSEATAAAAAASISANLAASVSASRNQLLYNSTGARGMDGWVGGPNWSTQDFGYGFGRGFNCAVSGSYLYNDNAHFAEIAPESWVTWSADPKIFGGTCDIWFEFYDSSFNRVGGNYAGRQVANRDFGDTVSGEALAPANAFNARLVVWPNFSAGGSAGVRRMKVERGRLPATAWSDEGTTEALAASLSVTAAVAADAQTRLSTVRFDVTGGAGGDPFQIWARADASGSAAGLIATELSLSNVVGGSVVPALKLADGRAVFGAPVSIIKNGRRTTMGPGFGVGSSLHFWSGPDTIGFGSETVDNGLLGISDTDGFFGGRTINGPFDSGAVSATVITVTTAWTTVATVASKDVGPTGSFLFSADWRATLSPKSPPPEAPAYGLNWRMVSTNLAGGDLRVIATGYADGNADVANTIMGVQYRLVEGHSSPRAPRRLLLQLAMSGADDTQAASAHSARLQGVYYQT